MFTIILAVSGLNLVVVVGGVWKFARWTGIVDTRLAAIERHIFNGDETGPAA